MRGNKKDSQKKGHRERRFSKNETGTGLGVAGKYTIAKQSQKSSQVRKGKEAAPRKSTAREGSRPQKKEVN